MRLHNVEESLFKTKYLQLLSHCQGISSSMLPWINPNSMPNSDQKLKITSNFFYMILSLIPERLLQKILTYFCTKNLITN